MIRYCDLVDFILSVESMTVDTKLCYARTSRICIMASTEVETYLYGKQQFRSESTVSQVLKHNLKNKQNLKGKKKASRIINRV